MSYMQWLSQQPPDPRAPPTPEDSARCRAGCVVTCPWSARRRRAHHVIAGMHARDANPKAGRWCCGRAAASRSRRICKSNRSPSAHTFGPLRFGSVHVPDGAFSVHPPRILITTANSHQAREHHQLPACDEPAGLCAPTADPGHARPLRHYRQWGITGYRVGPLPGMRRQRTKGGLVPSGNARLR